MGLPGSRGSLDPIVIPRPSGKEGCLGNKVIKAECSPQAGCVPVKAKVCWEMGGEAEESASPGSSLTAAIVKGLLCQECWKGSSRVHEVCCPLTLERD